MENSESENVAAEVTDEVETPVEDTKAQVCELTEKLDSLTREKQELEEDFGLKRAQLKGLFLQKEEELKQERELRVLSDESREKIEEELCRLKLELDEARNQVIIAECTKENEIEAEKRKCQEEVATLQQLLKESVEEASMITRNKYYSELKRLLTANSKLEAELQEARGNTGQASSEGKETLLGPGVLSAMTKTLARKVGGLTPSGGGGGGGGGNVSSSTESLQENLEDSMRKAQEDAEVLRSLVVPLEEEIKALKDKLRAADDQLRMYENTQSKIIKSSEVVGDLLKGKPLSEVVSELDEKLREVSSDLQVEKASRADLEMYVAILNTQKTVLQEDCDRLRSELKDICRLLEEERRAHSELKHTWQRANDQFLEAQRLQIQDMQRMQSLLTGEQVKTLAEMKRKDEEEINQKQAQDQQQLSVANKEEEKPKRGSSPSYGRGSPAFTRSSPVGDQENKERSNAESNKTGPSSFDYFHMDDNVSITSVELGCIMKTPGESSEPSGFDSLQDSSQRLTTGEVIPGHQRWSPEKLPGLTEAQYKALSDMTPELDARKATLDLARNSYSSLSIPSGKRLVSEREWMLLQEEVRRAREKVGQRCAACVVYESELQKSRGALKEAEKERKALQKSLGRYKDDLMKEWTYRKEVEAKWTAVGEEYRKEVSDLSRRVEEADKVLKKCQQASSEATLEVQKQVQNLVFEREQVQRDLERLQEENDVLIGKHTMCAEELQNEVIDLPNSIEELQVLLLKYREDLITAKIAKEHCEEMNKHDNFFLHTQLSREQQMKDSLSAEIDSLRGELGILQSIRSQCEEANQQKLQTENANKELLGRLTSTEARHKQIVAELQRQLEDNRQQQAKLNAEIVEQRSQASTLQKELDNSEAVQKDFVRLSQTLQMQLEKLREEEKELRWQHEDDVEECNNCKAAFNVTRRKHHCRHCGRIFCTECLTRSVESGPNKRLARVCDVCHTLLVKDTPPYFSTEIPHTPD